MNQEKINRDLRERDTSASPFQQAVIEYCRKCICASSARMNGLHKQWDNNSYIYRGYRVGDRDDADAVKDGEPPKIIVPITYAQVQTAISFILSTFMQRENIFETRGRGPEDEKYSFAINTDLNYQLSNDKFILKLYFWLLDSMKQGFGIVRNEWREEYVKMRVSKQVPKFSIGNMLSGLFGSADQQMESVESVEEVLAFQGNRTSNISPYAFYPDPSVTIAKFQEGQFVAVEEDHSLAMIKSLEDKVYHGTDKIPDSMGAELFKSRARRSRGPFHDDGDSQPQLVAGKSKESDKVIITEYEITLSEKEASKVFQAKLGDGTDPVKWLITIANDQKVIRFEAMANLHGRYSMEMIEFSPDHDAFFNPGLADTIYELQNIITFFLNSHIVNVRKIIANRFIVDENKVNTDDIDSGKLYIRLKGVTGDIKRVIEQLQVSDVTRQHVGDMDVLTRLVQLITGVNENALGQYAQGRRSATEARNVNAGAAARLKMHATLAWLQGIEPLGRQYLANTRQWRTPEVYEQIVGEKALECPFERVILADPAKIAGGYDFVPYDATL